MSATGSLMRVSDAQLATICRASLDTASNTTPSLPWWRVLGAEPVTIDWAYGERVIDHTRHHWCVPLLGMARMSVEVLGVGAMSIGMALLPFSVGWLQLTMALCAVAHQCWMARHLLRWRSDLIIATNWRLIRTGGILSSGVQSYRWDTINNISRNAKPLARLFRCWNIRVVQGGGWHNEGASLEYVIRVPRRMAILIEQLGSRPAGELRDQVYGRTGR